MECCRQTEYIRQVGHLKGRLEAKEELIAELDSLVVELRSTCSKQQDVSWSLVPQSTC